MLRRILLPLSGSPLTPAAQRTAVALAKRHAAHLTGLALRQTAGRAWLSLLGGTSGVSRAMAAEEDAMWQRITQAGNEFTHACDEAGIASDLIIPQGDPFEVLLTYGGAYDLVVFGLQGLFDHPLVDDARRLIARLIAGGLGPTYAVAGPAEAAAQRAPVCNAAAILVALSGSPASLRALRDLLYLDLHIDADLHLLHVGEDRGVHRGMLARAEALAIAHGRRVVSSQVRPGPVLDTIRQQTDELGCDLIVMGDSGRSLMTRDVLGDVALSMMRDSRRPLLLSH